MIGKIVRLPLRDVWKHEAQDFTTWLVENIDVLSEALDLRLQEAKTEQAAVPSDRANRLWSGRVP
jgi:hypothetical protein